MDLLDAILWSKYDSEMTKDKATANLATDVSGTRLFRLGALLRP
jgi:hypothetical protein